MARVKKIAEAMCWFPGFAPHEDPIAYHGSVQDRSAAMATVIPFPLATSAAPAAVVSASVSTDVSSLVTRELPKPKTVWPRLDATTHTNLRGDVTKFTANVEAIDLVTRLEAENRAPTDDERLVLNQYTGWGGIPKVFNLEQNDLAWKARAESLQALLGDQYESARASVNNAHYTEVFAIEAMWEALRRFGFTGGRVIEPSAGAGYFVGAMPKDMAEQSEITTIEIDQVSSRFLKSLYGSHGVKTHCVGFEKAKLPEDWFDLAISNVPFGNYKVAEMRNVPHADFLIHDYFFGRALEVVRPGGLVAFITSSGTMDKHDRDVRKYLSSRAKLLGAIRLPSGTFGHLANTNVTTDVIFLQKREEGDRSEGADWLMSQAAPQELCAGQALSNRCHYVNQYYHEHPEMLIGKFEWKANGYSKDTALVYPGDDVKSELDARISKLPEGIYTPRKTVIKLEARETRVPSHEYVKPGAYCLTIDGEVAVSEGEQLLVVEGKLSATAAKRIRGMIEIRNAARKLLHVQSTTNDDHNLGMYRIGLNIAYDNFVTKHGYIHARANRLAFRADPDMPLLLSLEHYDEETEAATKADVFYRRTVGVTAKIEKCDTPEEAMLVSLHEKGRIDPELMASLLDRKSEDVLVEMADRGLIFQNPETAGWETSDEYLSGNVREKLAQAEAAGELYADNVQALQAVIPVDLNPGEIDARIGSTWIPVADYTSFLNEILELESQDSIGIEFSPAAGAWNVEARGYIQSSVAATQTWGTSRISAIGLFVEALNQQVATIRDRDPVTDKYFVNTEETIAAREKQQALKDKFREWIWQDEARAARLVRLYNDQYNAVRLREYDGSHLRLPGFSQAYNLHKHQKDGIWRIVSSGVNALLAHCVGAGKTLNMICAGMELRRLGMVSKPCYVVPNHMLEQFAAEFLRAYPCANILMASKEDLEGDKRRTLMSKIATGDWDAVLITHSSFERIKMSDDAMESFINDRLWEIECAIREMKSDNGRGNKIVKELERAKKVWTVRLEKLSAKSKKDDVLTFEELGIDQLFIDEAHYFKNLFRLTKMSRIAGLPNSSSERAFDMFVKTRHVMDKQGGRRGVVFATGTPVSNSMAELWTMQRYLQPKTLKANHVEQFDTWAGNFGESVTALEISPDGGGYRMNTRFARFVNLPELMTMFREIADIRTAEMLNLPVPRVRMEVVAAKPTQELKDLVATLVDRAEKIRNGAVHPSVDNMLNVTNDGRKAALDMRLMDPFAEDAPGSKVNLCVEKVFGVWQDTAAFKGAQVVFCDMSTPSSDRFNVYHDIRLKLVEMGVPAAEIAFVHDYNTDAAKAELFKAVREGRIRILLGSTLKMGVGTNIQTRLAALHHIDAPWRPSDVEQREGRIIRQGNLYEEVRIFRYVTEQSFDSYIWQTLETKARFIAQVMRGDTGMRSAEDVELAALSYAEVKALASGNPLVMEKAGVDSEVAKLSLLKSKWNDQQWSNRREKSHLPAQIEKMRERIGQIEADIADRLDVRGDKYHVAVGGVIYTDRDEAAEALNAKYQEALARRPKYGERRGDATLPVGNFAGFRLEVTLPESQLDAPMFVLKGRRAYNAGHTNNPRGMPMVIANVVNCLEERSFAANEDLARAEKTLAAIEFELSKPFDKEERLVKLVKRQAEINAALDLDKNQAGAMDAELEAA